MRLKKKILLIAPVFFDYYKEMLRELNKLGFEAHYICDAPSNSILSKALGRINKNLIKKPTTKYFNDEVFPKITSENYDYVLVIGGMTFAFTPKMLETIKRYQRKAEFILYQWDSEKNLPYSVGIHQYFDRIYSFDRSDCSDSLKYRFLPLFYTEIYENMPNIENVEIKYDCSYVGTAHPLKYKCVKDMSSSLKDIMPRQFIFNYMPSKLKYIYHKLTAKEFRDAKMSDFQTEKLSASSTMQIFKESKCILDAPQAGQTGLTIRTIECLGANRKIITTNEDIINYDFYLPSNILVYKGSINTKDKFFETPYEELPIEIYKKYSLKSWLETMIFDK